MVFDGGDDAAIHVGEEESPPVETQSAAVWFKGYARAVVGERDDVARGAYEPSVVVGQGCVDACVIAASSGGGGEVAYYGALACGYRGTVDDYHAVEGRGSVGGGVAFYGHERAFSGHFPYSFDVVEW